ncbi:hypothetical protein TWF506_001125 [Arthrobotrys conoides]|uniref:Uncharacterized protein n=1 Tax=Arthrobotrys conoides TaxID=74498 RepID=A0AAN8NX52_9PEZI
MSFGVPTGEDREENVQPTIFDFGPGFSTIDINTIIRSPTATSLSRLATTTTLAETTTLATLTRSRGLGGIDASSTSLIRTTSEDKQSTSTSTSIPTTRPPPVTNLPSLPSLPSIVIATGVQTTGTITATGMSAPTSSNSTDGLSSQPSETPSQPRISTGAAVGIALIVTVVLVLLGFGIFRYLKQKKNQGLPPPTSKGGKGKPTQMGTMPYMGNERSLEEGWESGSTIAPFTFDEPDRTGLGLGLRGIGEQRHSNVSLTRLPIHR